MNTITKGLIYILLFFPILKTEAKGTLRTGSFEFSKAQVKLAGELGKFTPENSLFGWTTSIDGEFAAISAPMEPIDSMEAGAVYIYKIVEDDWVLAQKIVPENPELMQRFGAAIQLCDNVLMISSPELEDKSGIVYVYEYNGSQWIKSQELKPKNPVIFQNFGSSIKLGSGVAFISSRTSDFPGNSSGTVYVFRQTETGWVQESEIVSPGTNKNDLFGAGVCIIDPSNIVISAPMGSGKISESGLVYIYSKSTDGWNVKQIIEPENGRTLGVFGSSIDYSTNRLIVGSMEALVDSVYSGEANLYEPDVTGNWKQSYQFVPENGNHHDHFGSNVVISDEYIIISSPKWDLTKKDSDDGTVFIFYKTGNSWAAAGQIIPEDLGKYDHFGLSVALKGEYLLVGNSLDDNQVKNNGSSYFYKIRNFLSVENMIPDTYGLIQNYPNPFSNSTTIYYNLPEATNVKISIYDTNGKVIAELMNREESAGYKQISWDGKPAKPGIYFYKIETNKFSSSRKMMKLK